MKHIIYHRLFSNGYIEVSEDIDQDHTIEGKLVASGPRLWEGNLITQQEYVPGDKVKIGNFFPEFEGEALINTRDKQRPNEYTFIGNGALRLWPKEIG